MLSITFKYVGAGDSIIIELESGDEKKIGIIDCKRIAGNNPTLEELKKKNLNKLDFILLSHPHNDHYNGLEEILDFCEKKNIAITLFGFTIDVNQRFLGEVIKSNNDKNTLADLWRKAIKLDKKGLIKHRIRINTVQKISLIDGYHMRFMAPIQNEIEEYYNSIFSSELKIKASSNPNLASLVTMIEADDWFVLLTSDVEKKSLRRIGIEHLKRSKYKKKMRLGQVPHHGSLNNHYEHFWKAVSREKDTSMAISVGPNKDDHPSEVVIKELEDLNYKVDLTWSESQRGGGVGLLDMFSKKTHEKHEGARDLNYDFT